VRVILFLLFGFILWRVIQIILRAMANSRRHQEDLFANQPREKPQQTFKDVKDADFEELPPDDKK
jgi:hypothetical protein